MAITGVGGSAGVPGSPGGRRPEEKVQEALNTVIAVARFINEAKFYETNIPDELWSKFKEARNLLDSVLGDYPEGSPKGQVLRQAIESMSKITQGFAVWDKGGLGSNSRRLADHIFYLGFVLD